MATNILAVVGHVQPGASDIMACPHVLSALSALGQPTRLDIFLPLMRHGAGGLQADAVAETIGCPHNTLSSHPSILARTGLIPGPRGRRTIIYRADVENMRALLAFLVTDCEGHPELCDFLDRGNANASLPVPAGGNHDQA